MYKEKEIKTKKRFWIDKKGKEWLIHPWYNKEQEVIYNETKKRYSCVCSKIKGGFPDCCPCGGIVHSQIMGHCSVCGGGICVISVILKSQ